MWALTVESPPGRYIKHVYRSEDFIGRKRRHNLEQMRATLTSSRLASLGGSLGSLRASFTTSARGEDWMRSHSVSKRSATLSSPREAADIDVRVRIGEVESAS